MKSLMQPFIETDLSNCFSGRTDPNDYYPGQQTDFYQLVDDTWVNLANTSFPVMV